MSPQPTISQSSAHDNEVVGDIRHAILVEKDWKAAYQYIDELIHPSLREAEVQHITRAFRLVTCPCCCGTPYMSGHSSMYGDFDIECEACEMTGLMDAEMLKAWHDEQFRRAVDAGEYDDRHGDDQYIPW